jgi:hypothetical protein
VRIRKPSDGGVNRSRFAASEKSAKTTSRGAGIAVFHSRICSDMDSNRLPLTVGSD